jgi:pyroglutamyl-peptidase
MDNSCKYEKLKVYISGYGPFMNIKNNPSHVLVESIINNKSHYEKQLNYLCELAHNEIYEVSVDYVSRNVTKCYSLIEKEVKCGGKELHLLVHFGVNASASSINLEIIAKNEIMDYIKPKCRISEEGEDLYLCKLDLDNISKELSKLGHNIKTSTDAGTYLCNFIYYKSSEKFFGCENVIPIFIHIPVPKVCSTDNVNECFLDFLKLLVNKYIKPVQNQY